MAKPEEIPEDRLEATIMEYIEVLERVVATHELMMPFLKDEEHVEILKNDNRVLTDIRDRIWKQFTPHLVDTIN